MKLEDYKEKVSQTLKDFDDYCWDYTGQSEGLDNELAALITCLHAMFDYMNAIEERLNGDQNDV